MSRGQAYLISTIIENGNLHCLSCNLRIQFSGNGIVHDLPPTHRQYARVLVRPLIVSDLETETATQLAGVAVEFHCAKMTKLVWLGPPTDL